MKDNQEYDDDATTILQLLEEPQDEGDLNEWLSGTMCSYYCQNLGFLHMDSTLSMTWKRTDGAPQAGVLRSSPLQETDANQQV